MMVISIEIVIILLYYDIMNKSNLPSLLVNKITNRL